MNEFSPSPILPPASDPHSPLVSPARSGLMHRKLWLGLTLPWLAGAVLTVVLSGAYLFAPYGTHDERGEDAFDDAERGRLSIASGSPAGGTDAVQWQHEVATMVGGVRTFAETNRAAISRLAETVKTHTTSLATLVAMKQQLADLQAQNSQLAVRLSVLEAHPVTGGAQANDRVTSRPRSALAGMRLDAVQHGMAWVYWQGKTWAVKAGDRLGNVTITRIDAERREVSTNAGVLK